MSECSDCHVLAERVNQLEKRIYERLDAEEKVRDAVGKALDARLETMNEFRTQLNRQAGSFVTWPLAVAAMIGVATLVDIALKMVRG